MSLVPNPLPGKSLDKTHPETAKQWHPTKNDKLKPSNFTYGSGKIIWWKCPKGEDHEWEASIDSRSRGRGCPCCTGKKTCKDNQFDLLYPDLAKEWHPTKNGKLKPWDFTYGSSKKVWWKCPKGKKHVWNTTISRRTGTNGTGCPHCYSE